MVSAQNRFVSQPVETFREDCVLIAQLGDPEQQLIRPVR
jgi:hypothetical protein